MEPYDTHMHRGRVLDLIVMKQSSPENGNDQLQVKENLLYQDLSTMKFQRLQQRSFFRGNLELIHPTSAR